MVPSPYPPKNRLYPYKRCCSERFSARYGSALILQSLSLKETEEILPALKKISPHSMRIFPRQIHDTHARAHHS